MIMENEEKMEERIQELQDKIVALCLKAEEEGVDPMDIGLLLLNGVASYAVKSSNNPDELRISSRIMSQGIVDAIQAIAASKDRFEARGTQH
jgi:hypothetical protein